jgi:hypothetical protein
METVRYTEIDGQQIVLGFDRLNIDPMATRRRVLEALVDSGLAQELTESQAAVKAAVTIIPDPKGAIVKYADNYGQLMTTHNQIVARYAAEHDELTQRLTVYFQPRAGEVVVAADRLALLREFKAALTEGQKLTLEGEVIDGGSERQ